MVLGLLLFLCERREKVSRQKKLFNELTGHWSTEELARRKKEQDTIIARYQTSINKLSRSEEKQLGEAGVKAFYCIVEVVNAKGNYNDNADRQFLLNACFYIGILQKLREEIHECYIDEYKDILRTIQSTEKSLEFSLKTLGLTPTERNKIIENSEGMFNLSEEELEDIIESVLEGE